MTLLQSINYLRDDPRNVLTCSGSEWLEAGLWGAVCTLAMEADQGKTVWNENELDELLRKADYP